MTWSKGTMLVTKVAKENVLTCADEVESSHLKKKKTFKYQVQWNRADLANYQAEMDLLQHVPIESETVLDHPE